MSGDSTGQAGPPLEEEVPGVSRARIREVDSQESTTSHVVSAASRGDGAPPEVAIVSITLDDPIGIRRTVRSVQRQTFTRYEHVVVDGGSGPEVVRWLEEWERADPGRRLLLTDAPAGIYPAMNTGIRKTSAPLVLVLNGGDQLMPEVLGQVVGDHRARGWLWVYGGTEGRDKDDRIISHYDRPITRNSFRAGVRIVPHQTAYVARELYDRLGLYREDLGTAADQEFFLRALRVAEPARLPGILAAVESGGISTQGGMLRREVAWHRLRLASNMAFGGHAVPDAVVTALLMARQLLMWALGRARGVGARR
jgi:glycosyltransferase involved in cell wall biosynthesis